MEVSEWVQPEEPIPAGKDFGPIVGDFGHMEFDSVPIVGYLGHREDFDLEYIGTIQS